MSDQPMPEAVIPETLVKPGNRIPGSFSEQPPKVNGYNDEVRRQALQLYVDGMNLRRIGRQLGGIHHRTISLCVKAQAEKLPAPLSRKM